MKPFVFWRCPFFTSPLTRNFTKRVKHATVAVKWFARQRGKLGNMCGEWLGHVYQRTCCVKSHEPGPSKPRNLLRDLWVLL